MGNKSKRISVIEQSLFLSLLTSLEGTFLNLALETVQLRRLRWLKNKLHRWF